MSPWRTSRPSPHQSPRRWRPSFWPVALVVIALAEAGIIVMFFRAREVHRVDTMGPCLDECLGTWLEMMALGGLVFVWPVLALFCAGIAWALYLLVARFVRNRRSAGSHP